MSSVHHLREFICGRLTAAAAEIFSEVEKTILRYEEEMERQRRLLDLCWKPELKLHRVAFQQEPVHKTRILKDQQLCKQVRNSSLDQEGPEPPQFEDEEEPEPPQFEDEEEPEPPQFEDEEEPEPPQFEDEEEPEPPQFEDQNRPEPPQFEDLNGPEPPQFEDQEEPEPPQIKVEDEELCTNQEEDQLHLKQETDPVLVTDLHKESEPEPDKEQLISQSSAGPEDQDQDSGSDEKMDHTEGHHGNQAATSEMFSCLICGEIFFNKLLHYHHVKVHRVWNQNSDKLMYCCPTCGKNISGYNQLVSHLTLHTGEKRFSCKFCEKKFASSWLCRRHAMIHTGEKPFICINCGKCFNQNAHLKSHMKVHRDCADVFLSQVEKSFTK